MRFLIFSMVLMVNILSISHGQAVEPGPISAIDITGNHRVETPTIMSYIDIKPGDRINEGKVEEVLKNLFATGLFVDVLIEQQGDRLSIKVVENKIINRIAFEGNERLKDEVLLSEIALRPREVYTPARAQEAAQKIRDMYRVSGRYGAKVEPKIIEREQNRVDLVFEVTEGKATRVHKIIFVGNQRFSASRLESIILTKETRWYRFFSTDDNYDPDRLAYDKELLRKYYYEQGYVDFKVCSTVAELDPDTQEFYITYTIEEGKRYQFGEVKIKVDLPKMKLQGLDSLVTVGKGDWFNSREVEKIIDTLNTTIGEQGFAFIEIEPKLKRNPTTCMVDVDFVVKEGRHVYINRIDIVGNDRTDDEVIRREFRLSEGDPYNSVKLKRSEQRIQNLDYFKKVDIKQEPTAAPDQIDLKVEVEDKPTGSLQFSAGYSTTDGVLGSVTMNERNLMGKGYDLSGSAQLSQRSSDFSLGISDPYFLGKPLDAGLTAFHSSRKYNTKNQDSTGYQQTRTGLTPSIGYSLTEYLGQSWSYTIRRDLINDIRKKASIYLRDQRGTWIVSSAGHNLFYDKRNSSVDPTQGYYAALADEIAGLGGDVRYFKNSLRAGNYIPFDDDHKWVLATKGSMGAMTGMGKTTRVADRFELGGESLRGFADSGVGPRDKTTKDALGGLLYYKATIELSVPLGLPKELGISGCLFTDIGSVWHSGDKQKKGHPILSSAQALRVASGAGVNWRSPFGLIGVSLAKALIHKKHVDRLETFRVNFGTTF
ncbi:MAG: outer membrane protein assembly factor BamA [Alphaproteobacteria bacterium]|nr:outer membrane protein assembly factor BamA [Alphaproteobacteria bacterium]